MQSPRQGEVLISDPLHTHGDAHPSSNAQGRHALFAPSPLECMQQGHQHPAAGHADGMSKRDGAAVHVHLRRKLSASHILKEKFAPEGEKR